MRLSVFANEEYDRSLTMRELDIVNYLLIGKSAKATGQALAISPRTVEKHIDNITIKFGCRTRLEQLSLIWRKESLRNNTDC